MRLVIQGPNVTADHLAHLAALCDGTPPVELAAQAYAIGASANHPAVLEYCEQHRFDGAFVPDEQTLEQFGLLVMDMDSTLISIECIDEIADMLGIKPQVAAITESAMRGEIEFAESLRRRVALLAGLEVGALQRVYDERLTLNPGAEALIAGLRERGIRTLLVSGGFTFFTDRLKARLGLDFAHANTLEVEDGKLTGKVLGEVLDADGKARLLRETRDLLGLAERQVIAMGDGANDLKMMAAAGAGIAYHAKPVVRAQADYALNHVGLDGALNLFRAPR